MIKTLLLLISVSRACIFSMITHQVQFRHGGLNNSVDTMSDVLKEYNKGRDDIRYWNINLIPSFVKNSCFYLYPSSNLCKSLHETQSVLTARKTGQIALKDLWQKKVELENRLRMVREIEKLKVISAKVVTVI